MTDFTTENWGHEDFQLDFVWRPGQETYKYNLPMLRTLLRRETKPGSKQVFEHSQVCTFSGSSGGKSSVPLL